MNCVRLLSANILVYLLTVSAFAGQTWYPLTSEVEGEPTWEVLEQTQDHILLEVQIPGFYYDTINKETRIEIPGCQSWIETGWPEIPYVSCMIGIPECDSYTVTATPIDATISSEFYCLYPKPEEVVDESNGIYSVIEQYYKDINAYNTKSYLPVNPGEGGVLTSSRDQQILPINVYPVRYNPCNEKYTLTPVFQVQIDFDNPTGPQYPSVGPMGVLLDRMLIGYQGPPTNAHNYDELDDISWDWETASWCDYLIIADERYFENGEPVQELMDYALYREATNGYDIVIVNYPDDLPMMVPVDPHPERGSTDAYVMKMFIRQLYYDIPSRHTNDGHLSHVFMIGDLPDSGDRLQWDDETGLDNRCLSADAYFAKLDMDDDENMEELINKLPDVFVGRLPINHENEPALPSLDLYLDKIIDAEQYADRASLINTLYLTSPGTTQQGRQPLNAFDHWTRNTLTPVVDNFFYLRKVEADGSSDNQDLSDWPNMTQVDQLDVEDMRLSMNTQVMGGDRTEQGAFLPAGAIYNSAHGGSLGWSNYYYSNVDFTSYEIDFAPILMPSSCWGAAFVWFDSGLLFVDNLVYNHPGITNAGGGAIIGACAATGGAYIDDRIVDYYTLTATQTGEILYLYAIQHVYFSSTFQIIGDPAYDPIYGDVSSGNVYLELTCSVEDEPIIITPQTVQLEMTVSNISEVGTGTSFGVQVFAVCDETEYLVAETTVQGIDPNESLDIQVPMIPENLLPAMAGLRTFRFKVDMTPDDDGVIEEYYETENNVAETSFWIAPHCEPGYPLPLPAAFYPTAIEDLDPNMNNGPELFNSQRAINLQTGNTLWESQNNSPNSFIKTCDVDFNTSIEMVYGSGNILSIYDGRTGTLLHEHTIVHNGDNEYRIRILPYDFIPLSEGDRFGGMEFVVVANHGLPENESFLALYSLDYQTGAFQQEWINTYREVQVSAPATGHLINQNDLHITVCAIPNAGGMDDQNKLYIIDPVDGTAQITVENLEGMAFLGGTLPFWERCAAGDMDGNGIDEVYFLTSNALYRYDSTANPAIYFIDEDESIDFIPGPISLGNGFQQSIIADSPGLITSWVNGTFLAVDLQDPANPSTFFLPDASEPGFSHMSSLIGTFTDPVAKSIFCARRGESNFENILTISTANGNGYDNLEYRLIGSSYFNECGHWLYDIDNNGILDYLYFTNIYNGNTTRYIDVIHGDVPGTADWACPNGENGGTRHYGPIIQRISGTITGTDALQGTIIVEGNVTVEPGAYLTILPGSELLFENNTWLCIKGRLDANGINDNNRISFRHIDDVIGGWYGIFYDELSSGYLDYVSVEDAEDLITISVDADVAVLDFELADFTHRGVNGSKANMFAVWDGTIRNGVTGIECYRINQAEIQNVEIEQCVVGLNMMVTQPQVINLTIRECSQDGLSMIDCAGGQFDGCTFERNQQNGAILNNSTPLFINCFFYENGVNSIVMTSASNAVFGLVNVLEGNTFYNSGDISNPGFMQAELNAINSRPVFANRHNDFISTDGNFILCDQTFNMVEYNGSFNYYEGNPAIPSEMWFWPTACVSITNADPQMNYPERIPNTGDGLDEIDQALVLERDGNYQEASLLFFRLIREQSSPAAFSGWIRCQIALGVSETHLLETMSQFDDCTFLESSIFWTTIYLHNRIQDYETAISLLDSHIESSTAHIDSLAGMLAELNIYYEMLTHTSNPANGPVLLNESAAASSPTAGNHLLLSNIDQPVAAIGAAGTGRGTRTSHGAVREEVRQMGAYDYPVVSNTNDYFAKRNELLRRIGSTTNSRTPELPTSFELASPYPNPFNPTVLIPYNIPEYSSVRIQIYNVLGQHVATLVDETMRAGYHQVLWNGNTSNGVVSSSGVYFVTMEANEFHATRKIILLK